MKLRIKVNETLKVEVPDECTFDGLKQQITSSIGIPIETPIEFSLNKKVGIC